MVALVQLDYTSDMNTKAARITKGAINTVVLACKLAQRGE
jgi:hypothetical protein